MPVSFLKSIGLYNDSTGAYYQIPSIDFYGTKDKMGLFCVKMWPDGFLLLINASYCRDKIKTYFV